MALTGAQVQGSESAKVVIIEFADFQCPFCGEYARTVYPQLIRQLVDAGKQVRVSKSPA